ncbi:hypothetical protein J6590_050797 [Homalodisca vitripennis]|nr:hypothetical protein J6590_050797 [Homalodisca vitripennis]
MLRFCLQDRGWQPWPCNGVDSIVLGEQQLRAFLSAGQHRELTLLTSCQPPSVHVVQVVSWCSGFWAPFGPIMRRLDCWALDCWTQHCKGGGGAHPHLSHKHGLYPDIAHCNWLVPALLEQAGSLTGYCKDEPNELNKYFSTAAFTNSSFKNTQSHGGETGEPVASMALAPVYEEENNLDLEKNRSSIGAVNNFLDNVVEGFDRLEHVLGIFFYLSKAFGCVHHETLLHQLEKCGIRGLPHL